MSDHRIERSSHVVALCLVAALVACERPPMQVTQGNFRGVGVEDVKNPRLVEDAILRNQVPEPEPPVEPFGQSAASLYQNVQALGHVDATEFGRLMAAITKWVSPQQGCNYCHVAGNFADESVYTKHVSRRMIQMTQYINSQWKDHVGATGVTCYTCHRGQPVPAYYWYSAPPTATGLVGNKSGQNTPSTTVGYASLPYDPLTAFLRDDEDIRIQSTDALPTDNRRSIKQAEWTYGLMMHFSTSLGVNCTYCHNSRSFGPWEASSPARVTAWHGIRMVREINSDYIEPLADVMPANRKGPLGDPFKVNCTTCHQGVNKPLLGMSMLADYPNLATGAPGAAARESAAPADAAGSAASTDAAKASETPARS